MDRNIAEHKSVHVKFFEKAASQTPLSDNLQYTVCTVHVYKFMVNIWLFEWILCPSTMSLISIMFF